MSLVELDRRVSILERQLAKLMEKAGAQTKDWRDAIGLFPNNQLMKEIDAAGAAWRNSERRRTLRASARRR